MALFEGQIAHDLFRFKVYHGVVLSDNLYEKNSRKIEGEVCLGEPQKYLVRFWIEWSYHVYLWAGDERTRERFGVGPINERLPLSDALHRRGDELADWFQDSLNWDYPPDPGPWRHEECNRFREAARTFYRDLQAELVEEFEVLYEQHEPDEDPNLDEYLRDPQNFRRKS